MMKWLGEEYDPEYSDMIEVIFSDSKKRLRMLSD